jgi:hypothetical protein
MLVREDMFMKGPLELQFVLVITCIALAISSIALAISCLSLTINYATFRAQQSTRSTPASVTTVTTVTTSVQGYSLQIQNSDPTLNTYIENAQQEFAIVYPQLVTRWAANPQTAPRMITLRFVKNLGDAVETLAGQHLIEVDLDYAHATPYDPGVLTYALTPIVQNYPIYVPWLTEAIANYSSQLYGPRREDVYRSAAKYIPNTTYLTDPYDTGARFLFWISQNKRHDIVDRLNRILQAGNYTPHSFVQLTDETLDQLWKEYQADGGKVFTLQNKTPQQIHQSITALTPDLVTPITPTDAANWQVTRGNDYSCGFQDGTYTTSMATTNMFLPCAGLNTAGHNFAYQVDMTITQGDGGGIIGRGVGTNGLRFRVGSDGTFDLANGQITLIPSTSSSAIKQGQRTNTLLMAVEDRDIYLYVNGQYLGHASDTFTGGGYFGFMAVNFGHNTSVNYRNVKIWQW